MARYFLFLSLFFHVHLETVEFVLFTQPKTGTHLLISILTELTGKSVYWAEEFRKTSKPLEENFADASQNQECLFFSLDYEPWNRHTMDSVWKINKKKGTFLHLHAPYSQPMEAYLAGKRCINFFIKRDPRDQIVSLLNHYKYICFNDKEVEPIPTDDARLLYMIQTQLRRHTIHYMEWLKSPLCCVLDFEKLMGDHGGSATPADAMAEMKKIAAVLQLDLSNNYLEALYKRHFGRGWSFFKGKVGSWKDYFNDAHKAETKNEIGDLLIELGYEKDFNW